MSTLVWHAAGEKTFELGVDRGVLYLSGKPGVPWNGLISVSEVPSGGEVRSFFIDGVKYLNHVTHEDFQASIEAYTYPDEFAECDGTLDVGNGLFASHQRKKSFGLSYRTKIGNDVDGKDHAYRIHLVYNAIASPTQRANETISDSLDPFNFTWDIRTKPPEFKGYKPTAHFIVDTRKTPNDLLQDIEDILYGSDSSDPRLPSVPELLFMFEQYEASIFDAGHISETYFATFDAGHISETQTSTIDGGSP